MTDHKQHMVAVNLTQKDMTDITITHYCSDKTATFPVPKLGNGAISTAFPLTTVSRHDDSWDIVGKIDGKAVSVRKKQCNLPNGGGTTAIVFHEGTITYATPDNGPCSSKYD